VIAQKQFFCLRKQLDAFKGLPLAAGGDGGKSQCFRGFVTKSQLLKAFVRGMREVARFRAQV
jgi:hypothetical protein